MVSSRTLAKQPHKDTSSSATSPLACMHVRKMGMPQVNLGMHHHNANDAHRMLISSH